MATGVRRVFDEAIDRIIENDHEIAALMAQRVVLLDDARQVSELSGRAAELESATSSASSATSGSVKKWSPSIIARRELVSSVACALRLPERTAENLIETSRILLNDLRETHDALATGLISYRHAETIVDHALSIPTESTAEFEATVLAFAPTVTNTQLDRRAGRIRERMHPESIRTRHRVAVDKRCVDLTPARDGMAWLSAHLPAATATAAYNRITDLALHVEGPREGSTLTQLRADVFADLLVDGFTYELIAHPFAAHDRTNGSRRSGEVLDGSRAVRSIRSGVGRGIRATVHVTVPVMTLLGATEAPAELEGYGPIDAATARTLAAGAPSFHRILTHPETGAVLSVGRDSYAVPRDLRRWLVIRDETCRFPGCNRSARRSDIDHSIDWQYGSNTTHDNLAHLCSSHHHMKHQTAWSYTQHAGGRLEWTSPSRHLYSTEAAVHFRNDTVAADWVEQNRGALDSLRATVLRHQGPTADGVFANAERFIPHPDDPPDAADDDPRYFVIREAS